MNNLNIIAEVANSHNGNVKNIFNLIKKFSSIDYKNLSFKFQIISASGLSVKNHPFNKIYKKLEITESNWKKILSYTSKKYKVWIDVFDEFGLKILKENYKDIYGIKLQSSVLNNLKILNKLNNLKNFKKKIIVNFSGLESQNLKKLIENNSIFRGNKNVILQYGFQSYPTNIEDLNIERLLVIRRLFPKLEISFADHSSSLNSLSKIIPIFLNSKKINYIEKHICLSRQKSKYDYQSALELNEFKEMISNTENYEKLKYYNKKNINELKYLNNSIQNPILNKDLKKGELISLNEIDFKRTNEKKTNILDIHKYFEKPLILSKDKKKDEVLFKSDLSKPRIGIIIAGRLKSTRLKRKALLKIDNKPSIHQCLKSCTLSKDVDNVVLATSYLPEDKPLKKFTLNKKVKVFAGHPEDVIKRYLDAAKKFKLDVIVRCTADCPYISHEIVSYLLNYHFKNPSDFTYAKNAATGTSVEIYNTATLKKIKKIKKDTSYSEYMTWYVMNNKKYFKINEVNLPKKLSRNYRICLDYKEDLIMLNALYKKLRKLKLDLNLKNIFFILDKYKNIRAINKNCKLVYKTNKKLISFLNNKTKF